MMSPGTIKKLSDEAARKAAQSKQVPYMPFDEAEIDRWPPVPFPNLGSYCPEGWKLVEEWFVDSSGHGLESEPALTFRAMCDRVRANERDGKHYGYGIIATGQFQVYVGVFEATTDAARAEGTAKAGRKRRQERSSRLPPAKKEAPREFRCDLQKVPSDDGLAYVMGVQDGWRATHTVSGKFFADKARAYKNGYQIGLKLRAGAARPKWMSDDGPTRIGSM